ncbi:MAG TPA: tyrosine-type recombinase/integrase [Terriglobales bacterium]|nr:tyrosine-type recombinase/integrase [Terriglobales bacterium]
MSSEFPTAASVQTKADEILAPYNRDEVAAEGASTVQEFGERFFLPWVATRRRASTHKFYRDLMTNHITPGVGDIRLRDFKTLHAQRLLDSTDLSHQSLCRIKTGMSALFGYAIRLGFIDKKANPIRETIVEGTRSSFNGHAYTLAEVKWMLERLPEPARTVVGVAAYSGLRLAEIRGLRWEDYDGKFIHVHRSLWRRHVSDTKTSHSEASVPVAPALKKMLDDHKRRSVGEWIFTGPKKKFSLNLDNLARRDILPVVADRWHGWHAFRRGLGTILFDLGVPAESAKIILRHSAVAVTQKHYIKLQAAKEGVAAMDKLQKAIQKSGPKVGHRKSSKSR